jgi:hypothetical protein
MIINLNLLSDCDYCECQECGEECDPGYDICSLCYLKIADVQGEA